jgi:hypothetical protein
VFRRMFPVLFIAAGVLALMTVRGRLARMAPGGPFSTYGTTDTAANFGFEPASHISPIVPEPYQAFVVPPVVGIQFLADSTQNLRGDHFRISVSGPGIFSRSASPNVFINGLVGYQMPMGLGTGRYMVQFALPGFNMAAPRWTIDVVGPPPRASDASNSSGMLLDSLNTLRRSLNLTPVTSDSALLAASRMHARYLMKNGFRAPSFHIESAKKPGFVGVMPWNRDMSFGWPTRARSAWSGQTQPKPPP